MSCGWLTRAGLNRRCYTINQSELIPFKTYFLWCEHSVSFSEAVVLPPHAPLGESLLLNVFKTF